MCTVHILALGGGFGGVMEGGCMGEVFICKQAKKKISNWLVCFSYCVSLILRGGGFISSLAFIHLNSPLFSILSILFFSFFLWEGRGAPKEIFKKKKKERGREGRKEDITHKKEGM